MTDTQTPKFVPSLVVFEGGEGSGKSTAMAAIAGRLRVQGIPVTTCGCPSKVDGTISERVRKILLGGEQVSDIATETTLYLAAITDVLATVILPALHRGEMVLCDRFYHTLLVHQAIVRPQLESKVKNASHMATDLIYSMIRSSYQLTLWSQKMRSENYASDFTRLPITFYLHAHTKTAQERIRGRGVENHYDASTVEFLEAVESTYVDMAKWRIAPPMEERPYLINANRPADHVADSIEKVLMPLLTTRSKNTLK